MSFIHAHFIYHDISLIWCYTDAIILLVTVTGDGRELIFKFYSNCVFLQ